MKNSEIERSELAARIGQKVRALRKQRGLSLEELALKCADAVKNDIITGANMRGSAEYRRHLAGVLTKRAVVELEARTAQEEN